MVQQLLAELEADERDFAADSWSLAVDGAFLQLQRADVMKRQDVIYGEMGGGGTGMGTRGLGMGTERQGTGMGMWGWGHGVGMGGQVGVWGHWGGSVGDAKGEDAELGDRNGDVGMGRMGGRGHRMGGGGYG